MSRLSFQILMVLIYPTVIQPLFNKLTPLPQGDLRKRVESLASQLKFPLKHLYEIDGSKRSSHSNAYFFGLPWVMALLLVTVEGLFMFLQSKHIVIFDTLIKQSKTEEVEAVLGKYSVSYISDLFSSILMPLQPTNSATGTTCIQPSSSSFPKPTSSRSLLSSLLSFTPRDSSGHSIFRKMSRHELLRFYRSFCSR